MAKNPLENAEVERYSRQLILPEIGVAGQIALKSSKVLICGAGGLGCPSAQYLAAAGVGTIGIIDYDTVEVSNLHRQVGHRTDTIGVAKTESLKRFIQALNPLVNVICHNEVLTSENALQIIKNYDIVLDASDNVATRYLVNDCCVLAGKPLVSGSALRFEGQLMVYNYKESSCYRCVYPVPPPAATVTNCSDGGVLGVVPGIIGSIQALETMKIILPSTEPTYFNSMLLFNALECSFKKIRMRGKNQNCPICGKNPTITEPVDYLQFCGVKAADDKDKPLELLENGERMTVEVLKKELESNKNDILLIDVREPVELEILSPLETVESVLANENFLNIPLKVLENPFRKKEVFEKLKGKDGMKIVCLCRRGNSSQKAVIALNKFAEIKDGDKDFEFKKEYDSVDLIGGYTEWVNKFEPELPMY